MRIFFSLLFSTWIINSLAQNTPPTYPTLNLIDSIELRKHIEVLTSDSLEGRFTGSADQKKAATYILSQFKQAELKPFNDTCFYQPFELYSWHWGDVSISDSLNHFKHYLDFVYMSHSPIEPGINAPCVYIGEGNINIVNSLNLDGKIALALTDNFANSYKLYSRVKQQGAVAILVAHMDGDSEFAGLSKRIKLKHNQKRLYLSQPDFGIYLSKSFAVTPNVAESLFGVPFKKLKKLCTPEDLSKLPQPVINLSCPIVYDTVITENVAGYIEGKSRETIVLSAHYDHLGKKGDAIFYGADDNASGTSALITLAKALKQHKEPFDKTILFLATTAEETELFGALHFAEQQNNLPFDIMVNLNIDMIGRRDSSHKHNYLYLIGADEYPQMDSICRVANRLDSLTLDYSYDGRNGFGNFLNLSDHYAFHKQCIPVLGFFSGLHPDYHKPTDTIDKIVFDELLKRVRLIYATTILTSNSNTSTDN